MEHSDDYVLILLYKDEKEFIEFRIIHKIMMRLHGFNDSERKTSCQNLFMEFVSLMSFNGVMLYPQIKKSKEVNTNLPCTGYTTDMKSAMSRIGECMRWGCNQSFLYFMQKLHSYCLLESYSLLPNMRNWFYKDLDEAKRHPVEMYGIPDTLPLFSLFCKGDINNYRLMMYSEEKYKKNIVGLYNIAKDVNQRENILHENNDYSYSVYNPRFLYESDNKNIMNMRKKINMSKEDLENFWSEHISYRFIKPKSRLLLIKWIRSMFYNRTFTEAYTKTTRTRMTMRLSRYTSKRSIKSEIKFEDIKDIESMEKGVMTIRESFEYMKENINKHEKENNELLKRFQNLSKDIECLTLSKIITKCDPTVSAIYSILENLVFGLKKRRKNLSVAAKMPRGITTMSLVNNPSVILQKLYNPNDFISDKRKIKSEYSLQRDIAIVRKTIPKEILNSKETLAVLSVYNDMMMCFRKQNIMICGKRRPETLEDCVINVLEDNYHPWYTISLRTLGITKIIRPSTREIGYLKKEISRNYYKICLDNLCMLYTYLNVKRNMTVLEIKHIFDNLYFDGDNNTLTVSDLLNKYDRNYFKYIKDDMNERKIVAYLKFLFMNDSDLINDLANSCYVYSYKYERTAVRYQTGYKGMTICNFRYLNKNYKVYQKDNKTPLLISSQPFAGIAHILYNICLKLANIITSQEHDNDFYECKYKDYMVVVDNEIKKMMERLNIKRTFMLKKNDIIPVDIKNIMIGDQILPFFQSKITFDFIGEKVEIKKKIYPRVDHKDMKVTLGRNKLYTLPFWKCYQTDNVKYTGSNREISLLLNYNRLQSFLKDRPIHCLMKGELLPYDYKKEIMKYLSELQKENKNTSKITIPQFEKQKDSIAGVKASSSNNINIEKKEKKIEKKFLFDRNSVKDLIPDYDEILSEDCIVEIEEHMVGGDFDTGIFNRALDADFLIYNRMQSFAGNYMINKLKNKSPLIFLLLKNTLFNKPLELLNAKDMHFIKRNRHDNMVIAMMFDIMERLLKPKKYEDNEMIVRKIDNVNDYKLYMKKTLKNYDKNKKRIDNLITRGKIIVSEVNNNVALLHVKTENYQHHNNIYSTIDKRGVKFLSENNSDEDDLQDIFELTQNKMMDFLF